MRLGSRVPMKQGFERQSHHDSVQRRIQVTAFFASVMAAVIPLEANFLEDHHTPIKGWLADWSHAELGKTTEPEKKIETALQKALGKRVTVRCAKIDTSPEQGVKPEAIDGFKYTGMLDSDALRLSPQVCDDLMALKNIDASKPINVYQPVEKEAAKRTTRELRLITSLGLTVADKDASSDVILCRTIQRTYEVARNLGATDFTAYKFAESIASPYQNDEGPIDGCYENGPLDMDPDNSAFIPLGPPSK